jgi:iron complex outermembrane receptor protein
LTTASGFNLTTSYLSVGKIPMNDQNSKYTDAYSLLDFKASYDFAILKNIKQLSTGVNNLLTLVMQQAYCQCNWFWDCTTTILLSGNPRNYYGGLAVSYLLKVRL